MNTPKVPGLLDLIVYPDLRTARARDAQRVVELPSNLKEFFVAQLTIDTALASIPMRWALYRALRRGGATACAATASLGRLSRSLTLTARWAQPA